MQVLCCTTNGTPSGVQFNWSLLKKKWSNAASETKVNRTGLTLSSYSGDPRVEKIYRQR